MSRLVAGADPEIGAEAARLSGNLAATASALKSIDALLALGGDADALSDLKAIRSNILWLQTACGWMSFEARRAVCERVPEPRRRAVVVSAMEAVRASCKWGVRPSMWSADALGHATVLGAASILDPIVFERAIREIARAAAPGARSTSYRGPRRLQVPHFADAPSIWCSFVLGLFDATPSDSDPTGARAAT